MKKPLILALLLASFSQVFSQNKVPLSLTGDLFSGKTWVLGLSPTKVVFRNKAWDYRIVGQKGSQTTFKLTRGKDARHLSLSVLSDSEVLLAYGNTKKRLKHAPQNDLRNETLGDIDVERPVRPDTAIYAGFINGYSPSLGYRTGNIFVHDVITGLSDNFLIDIAADGTFITKFPLSYTKACWIALPFFNGPVYFEPGKELFQKFELHPRDGRWFSFMGTGAQVNTELLSVKPLYRLDYAKLEKDILPLSPAAYKSYLTTYRSRSLAILDSVAKVTGMSIIARRIAQADLQYEVASALISYNRHKENAYRRANNISFTDKAAIRPIDTLDEAYHDLLKDIKFDSPDAKLYYNYWEFINKIRFLDLVTAAADTTVWNKERKATIAYYKKKDSLTQQESDLVKLLERAMPPSDFYQRARPVILGRITRQSPTYELELIHAQELCGAIQSSYQPMTEEKLLTMRSQFTYPDIYGTIIRYNEEVRQAVNRRTLNIPPGRAASSARDDVFESILNRSKGKVIVLDFWATWCVPCMFNIKEVEPLKKEFMGKPVSFVYVTNQTSPENVYNVKVLNIKGEHYRVSQDQWNALVSRFKISGIPHTVIIGKAGEIDNSNKYQGADALRNRLFEALGQVSLADPPASQKR